MNTLEGALYIRGIMSTLRACHFECGGYHEYSGGYSVHSRDTMTGVRAYHDDCQGISSVHGDIRYTRVSTQI